MSQQSEPKAESERLATGAKGRMALLFLISLFGLYLELVVIRWVGTEVRIFAYLQNTVLVVCFLGLGMGAWTSQRPFSVRWLLVCLFLLVALLAIPFTRIVLGRISGMVGGVGGLLIWYGADELRFRQELVLAVLGLVLTFLMMLLIWSVFVPIGRLMGRLLNEHHNTIWAYSVNVAGSLVGIWLFVALSALRQPPLTWFAVGAVMAAVLAAWASRSWWIDGSLLVGIVALAWFAGREPGADEVIWSPYQKLALWTGVEAGDQTQKPKRPTLRELLSGKRDFGASIGDYLVTVNNVGYQAMIDLSAGRLESDPDRFDPAMRGLSQYDLPAALHPEPRSVLIVGAGAGNDAAGALRGGAEEVVAVEIDPAIIDLGHRYHPERPYDSPRVQVVNDDARSFFATTDRKFDVIAFGLLDSHTTTAMTNARLDHYVYTRESIQRAKDLLNDGGIMVLSFEAQKPFIADRLARVLTDVFQYPPLVFRVPYSHYGWGGVFFVTGDLKAAGAQIDGDLQLRELLQSWSRQQGMYLPLTARIATDDWPYLYLESPHIPVLYYFLAGMMLVLFLLGVALLRAPTMITSWNQSEWHFFWLGAAFMLLEVQNISKAAVVLGNTWEVNAIIISAILMMILVANWLASRFRRVPLAPVYMLLCGTCLVLYFVDLSAFAFLPYPAKAAIVGALVSMPMLFSGIVFIRSFAAMERKDAALAANLMGALVGGLLQSVTFLTGIKALLLIVAGLYLLALLTRPRPVRELEASPAGEFPVRSLAKVAPRA